MKKWLAIGLFLVGLGQSWGQQETSLTGYGELHYNHPNVAGKEKDRKMDFHRMVVGIEHSFRDDLSLHVEVDFEHAAAEMELEFAYLEQQLQPGLSLRAGSLLMPVGPLNEFHEPPLFPSVERPTMQKVVIPTTWNEGGAGLVYRGETWRARGYLVGGLDGSKFRKKDGIRAGRGKVAEGPGDDIGFVGRLEFMPALGASLGASFYTASADAGDPALSGLKVNLFEGDLTLEKKGWKLVSAFAQVDIDGAEKVEAGNEPASKVTGWYATLSKSIDLPDERKLVPFLQVEEIDTHDEVPATVTRDLTQRRKIFGGGVSYYVSENVAYKFDLHQTDFSGDKDDETQWNLGIAWMF